MRSLRDGIPNLEGMISGRAIYDGHIDIAEGAAMLKEKSC